MNDLVHWLFSKVMLHLKNHEGCQINDPTKTSDSLRAVVQDALGFRYEVQIKCLGRIQHVNEAEKLDLRSKYN